MEILGGGSNGFQWERRGFSRRQYSKKEGLVPITREGGRG